MFNEFLGHTADESTLFYLVSDKIIQNFSQMRDEVYYFELAPAENGIEKYVTITKIHRFADFEEGAQFYFSHEFVPHALFFQRRDLGAKVVLTGKWMFMAHEIHSGGFRRANIHEHNPNYRAKMLPREVSERAFGTIKAKLKLSRTPKAV